jgi:hypothetical protein
MKLATAYFPSTPYFQQVIKNPKAEIILAETYQKQSPRNHCVINTANGPLKLTVPIIKPKGSKTLTKDILLDESQNWRIQHWRSITSAYKHSPYFEEYETDIHQCIFNSSTHLHELNNHFLKFVCRHLDFTPPIPNFEDHPQGKIIDCFPSNTKLEYMQVFDSKVTNRDKLSLLDSLFCLGPICRTLIH